MRTPLRPLARILQARQEGLNPDSIEKENLKLRHEAMREKVRGRAQFRLFILCASFVFAFGAIGARMGLMAATEPVEPKSSAPAVQPLLSMLKMRSIRCMQKHWEYRSMS